MADYRPPRPGEGFSAADYVHFKLEYINAVKSALPEYRERLGKFVFLRFNTSPRFIKNFIADPKNRSNVAVFLKENSIWAEKIELAEKQAREKKVNLSFLK